MWSKEQEVETTLATVQDDVSPTSAKEQSCFKAGNGWNKGSRDVSWLSQKGCGGASKE